MYPQIAVAKSANPAETNLGIVMVHPRDYILHVDNNDDIKATILKRLRYANTESFEFKYIHTRKFCHGGNKTVFVAVVLAYYKITVLKAVIGN